jgi:hypothetical protein
MPENSELTPQYQDDALASFVDRLLMGQELDPAQGATSDEELRAMQAMAMRFARISRPITPPPAMAQRMSAALAAEFRSTIQPAPIPVAAKTQPAESWWNKVKELGSELTANQNAGKFRARRRQQTFSFVLAGVTVIALVFAAFFVPMPGSNNQTVAAVAIDNPIFAVVAVVIAIAIAASVWYFTRPRR